ATFQPETVTTGWAPWSDARRYDACSVSDSPGHSVVSLSDQKIGRTSLSPPAGLPAAFPRRTSARRKTATVGLDDVVVIVTSVVVSASAVPAGAACVVAVTEIDARPSLCSCCRSA